MHYLQRLFEELLVSQLQFNQPTQPQRTLHTFRCTNTGKRAVTNFKWRFLPMSTTHSAILLESWVVRLSIPMQYTLVCRTVTHYLTQPFLYVYERIHQCMSKVNSHGIYIPIHIKLRRIKYDVPKLKELHKENRCRSPPSLLLL